MLNTVSNYGKQINFNAFAVQTLERELAEAQEKGNGIEIEIDPLFNEENAKLTSNFIVTEIHNPDPEEFINNGEICHFRFVDGYIINKEAKFIPSMSLLMVNRDGICKTHNIVDKKEIPEEAKQALQKTKEQAIAIIKSKMKGENK